jgi:hypothetical protein
MAQTVSRRPLTAETWVRAFIIPCGILGGTGTGCSPSSPLFLSISLHHGSLCSFVTWGMNVRPHRHEQQYPVYLNSNWCFTSIFTNDSLNREAGYLSQYSVWLRTGRPGDRGLIAGRGRGLCVQTGSWGPPSLLSNGYRVSFPGVKCGRGVTLTTHPHLVPGSRMCRTFTSSRPKLLHGVLWECFVLLLLL